MDYRKLKSGSDVRGVAVGEGATLTPDVAKTLGVAFARYVAGKTGKPVERVSIALGRDSRHRHRERAWLLPDLRCPGLPDLSGTGGRGGCPRRQPGRSIPLCAGPGHLEFNRARLGPA